jgi:hypothetical protein
VEMIRIQAEDLDWLLELVDIKPDTRIYQVLRRRYLDGYRDEAIAAELGIKASTVRVYACQGWGKIDALIETGRLGEAGQRARDRLELSDLNRDNRESWGEHVEAIYRAIQNGTRCQATPLSTVAGALMELAMERAAEAEAEQVGADQRAAERAWAALYARRRVQQELIQVLKWELWRRSAALEEDDP